MNVRIVQMSEDDCFVERQTVDGQWTSEIDDADCATIYMKAFLDISRKFGDYMRSENRLSE